MSIADGCKVRDKNFLTWQVEDGNLGMTVEDDNLGKVVEDDSPGKGEENDSPGKVEENESLGKVEEDDSLGKVEEQEDSLGKDKLQVCKSEMMEKQQKNACCYLLCHEIA